MSVENEHAAGPLEERPSQTLYEALSTARQQITQARYALGSIKGDPLYTKADRALSAISSKLDELLIDTHLLNMLLTNVQEAFRSTMALHPCPICHHPVNLLVTDLGVSNTRLSENCVEAVVACPACENPQHLHISPEIKNWPQALVEQSCGHCINEKHEEPD